MRGVHIITLYPRYQKNIEGLSLQPHIQSSLAGVRERGKFLSTTIQQKIVFVFIAVLGSVAKFVSLSDNLRILVLQAHTEVQTLYLVIALVNYAEILCSFRGFHDRGWPPLVWSSCSPEARLLEMVLLESLEIYLQRLERGQASVHFG